jgi:glycerol-3-phosphate dehydrogenase
LGFLRPTLAEITKQPFDVVVIGGGINGAGIAREAQHAGYRTLLIERLDFGAGTTSRATRLIHGGLRYLEHGELALVYESLTERETLVREAAHLVRPLKLLVPVYAGDERPPWKIRAGLTLYDALSFRKSMPRHHAVPLGVLETYEPGLNRDGLNAAYTFYDAQLEFPERIVAETVREFMDAGGVALNHASVRGLVSPAHTLRGVLVEDHCSGTSTTVTSRCVVNAAGPWVDEVLRGTDAERHEPLIGGTKGSHVVVEWPDGPRHALFTSARSDGRPFFILPWYHYTLIGTTDIRYDGDPSAAQATPQEVAYLLDEANRLFPGSPVSKSQVLYSYCGVRPLPYTPDGSEGSITRSHMVVDHAKRGGPTGLLSVVGGKLTTYRSLSRSALTSIRKNIGSPEAAAPIAKASRSAPATEAGPLAIYGPRSHEVRELIASEPTLNQPICEHNPDLLGQVAYAVDRECAVTLADVFLRRLPVGWSKCHALDGTERAIDVIATRLGWDTPRRQHERSAYESELRQTLVPVD